MEIIVNRKPSLFGAKYELLIDGQTGYSAETKLIDLMRAIMLLQEGNHRPRMTIGCSNNRYDITRWDNNVLRFMFINCDYCCQCGDEYYEIFRHKGRMHSIFKNSTQVGFWDKAAGSWFSANHYHITADNDCDFELLICFCIIIDDIFTSYNHGAVLNVDLGESGHGLKEFDTNWKPKT